MNCNINRESGVNSGCLHCKDPGKKAFQTVYEVTEPKEKMTKAILH